MCAASLTGAAPLPRHEVPEPLRPWIDWVLRGHEDAVCARFQGDAERRQCAWPSQLTLRLDEHGGTFTQQWDVQRELWVELPGDAEHWPADVTVDGRAAPVVAQGGVPRVQLDVGRHQVAGRFAWDRLPERLAIPASTGLVALTLRGEAVPFPARDGGGTLWLQRREEGGGDEQRVDVTVHRAVRDDIPLMLVTRIDLEVAGKGREIVLGPVLPSEFTPMALQSPLPARLEADGRLRLQVRAGRWQLEIQARDETPADSLSAPTAQPPWDADEIWVFIAEPRLRLVSIEGVDAIDPQQTELPDDWRAYPAYLMRPGDRMRLVERRRGDADPAPDQLELQRTLWLDFDGGGYTIHDQIGGVLTRSARLDMAAPATLGRVAVDGRDQFITRVSETAPAGVELRPGRLQLDADSRLDGALRALPAVGWLHDFQKVSAVLQLPPGWGLVHARGVDEAAPTWVGRWTLLDLFIVLITALATARLFGWTWGVIALFAVGLSYNEPGAPGALWLAVLATEALVRLVPPGRILLLVRLARVLALVALVIVTATFVIGQIRQGIYPALERPWATVETTEHVASAPPAEGERLRELGYDVAAKVAREADEVVAQKAYRPTSYRSYIDPGAIVQTGPGLPEWQWDTVALAWSGPVEPAQELWLLLVPPWANLALAVLRTLLLALLVARLLRDWRLPALTPVTAATALLVLMPVISRADLPSDALLEELRSRLLEPPDCHPTCAAFPRMTLVVGPAQLRARLTADVAAAGAVPLPGQAQQWTPQAVRVDGQPDAILSQGSDGILWLYLESGRHEIEIEGSLPARDVVQIALPLPPHRVEARVEGWTLDGVHENGVPDVSLQLSRQVPTDGETGAALQPNQLPPFARVERTLRLPLTWQVETQVVRLSPPDTALVLEVPLLPGEAVTTDGIRVVDGRVHVNLAPNAMGLTWQSTLTQTSPIVLRAPEAVPWVEVWRLDASPIWHVEAEGIASVHETDPADAAVREWRPWPGESVTLDVSRPRGIGGQSLTIDRSEMTVTPGVRATDVGLSLSLRSSRGTQHALTLPDGAALQSVRIDGVEQPIRPEGRQVTLPIAPRAQGIELSWREPAGVSALLRSPAVDLGVASVNAHLRVAMPANRWILFAGGPRLGPAVLFWSQLPVILLIAIGLARVRFTPLRAHHWFLLGIGLTQVDVALAAVVVGWLLALGWRRERAAHLGRGVFDLAQIALVLWTVAALIVLFMAIQRGLLGLPDMQIAGNGSSAALLRWYADRAAALLPRAWVLSVPLLVYRLLMLAWALWLAQALLSWLRWGWDAFGTGGYWRPLRRRAPITPAPAPDAG